MHNVADVQEPQALSAIAADEAVAEYTRVCLQDVGYSSIKSNTHIHPYLDARVDLLAEADSLPAVVVEIRVLPVTAVATIDVVQQVQRMARLLHHYTDEETVGLLVTTGRISPIAENYAGICTPRVYIAKPETLNAVLDSIIAASA